MLLANQFFNPIVRVASSSTRIRVRNHPMRRNRNGDGVQSARHGAILSGSRLPPLSTCNRSLMRSTTAEPCRETTRPKPPAGSRMYRPSQRTYSARALSFSQSAIAEKNTRRNRALWRLPSAGWHYGALSLKGILA